MYHVNWSSLDKNLGVRPTGMGEVSHRIVCKCNGWVREEDIAAGIAAGLLETATGLQSGAEAAIHSMRCIFEDKRIDAVVDARNAFNSLNRQATLHNIQIICPQITTTLDNTYRRPTRLMIWGASDIYSWEGTTQGDNLTMAFYTLGTSPLVNTLQITSPEIRQMYLADDISRAGSHATL